MMSFQTGGTLDHALTQTVDAMRILDRHFYVWRLRLYYPEILSRIDASSMLGLALIPSLPNVAPLPSPYLSHRGETQKVPTTLTFPLDLTPLGATLEDTIPHNYFLFQADCHVRAVLEFATKTLDNGTSRQQRARARRRHCCGSGQGCCDNERAWPCCFPLAKQPSLVNGPPACPPPFNNNSKNTNNGNDNNSGRATDKATPTIHEEDEHDDDEDNERCCCQSCVSTCSCRSPICCQRGRRCCHHLFSSIVLPLVKSLLIETFRPFTKQTNASMFSLNMFPNLGCLVCERQNRSMEKFSASIQDGTCISVGESLGCCA
jgi:hypothetical protein